ncbi:LptF/LptG family permease, partial [Enterobacter hormaechei]
LPTERWDAQLSPQLLNTVVMEPEALSISGLWQYIHYLADQGLNNNRYWLAFWTKVLQPLVTAALVLMAISFIFGPLRSVTLGQRIFTGVLVGFALTLLKLVLKAARLKIALRYTGEHEAELRLSGAATFLKVPALSRVLDEVKPGTTLHVPMDNLSYVD